MGYLSVLILRTLSICYEILDIVILVYCIASWFIRPGTKVFYFWRKLDYFLSPLFYPARFILSKFRITERLGIDFTPWLTLILLRFVYRIIFNVFSIFLMF